MKDEDKALLFLVLFLAFFGAVVLYSFGQDETTVYDTITVPKSMYAYAATICHPTVLPDPACTPGLADPKKTADILCAKGYTTKSVRPPSVYTTALKKSQMTSWNLPGFPANYEEDHLISLELGGDPRDPRNLWPEAYLPKPGAREKDEVEGWLHRQVCSKKMTLRAAQMQISLDWLSVWKTLHPKQ